MTPLAEKDRTRGSQLYHQCDAAQQRRQEDQDAERECKVKSGFQSRPCFLHGVGGKADDGQAGDARESVFEQLGKIGIRYPAQTAGQVFQFIEQMPDPSEIQQGKGDPELIDALFREMPP